MKLVGILLALVGWLLPVLALGWTTSNGARILFCLVGIGITLTGILGVLNSAHQKEAIWKK